MNDRFERQLAFILEADRLKEIQRRSYLISGSRVENSAEHSWHLALNALILSEYANTGLDTFRVLRMLLVHDLVEIDAGDTFCYDAEGNATKAAREQAAACSACCRKTRVRSCARSGRNSRRGRRPRPALPLPWTVSCPCSTI